MGLVFNNLLFIKYIYYIRVRVKVRPNMSFLFYKINNIYLIYIYYIRVRVRVIRDGGPQGRRSSGLKIGLIWA